MCCVRAGEDTAERVHAAYCVPDDNRRRGGHAGRRLASSSARGFLVGKSYNMPGVDTQNLCQQVRTDKTLKISVL